MSRRQASMAVASRFRRVSKEISVMAGCLAWLATLGNGILYDKAVAEGPAVTLTQRKPFNFGRHCFMRGGENPGRALEDVDIVSEERTGEDVSERRGSAVMRFLRQRWRQLLT